MRHRYALVVLLLASVAACKSPRVSYATTEQTFKTLLTFTNDRIEAGDLPKEEAKKLAPAIDSANLGLKAWLQVILETPTGEKPNVPKAIMEAVLDALDVLEAYYLKETQT